MIEPDDVEIIPVIEQGITPDDFHTPSERERIRSAATTAKTLAELSHTPLQIDAESEHLAQNIFRDGRPITKTELRMPEVVVKLDALLTEYDYDLLADAAKIRNYVVNKLVEESHGKEARNRLKALELLGKLSEVGAFTERHEISVTHQTTEDLQRTLRERLSELIEVEDVEIIEPETPNPHKAVSDTLTVDDILRSM